jgi:hypothetical protein
MPSARATIVATLSLTTQAGVDAGLTISHRFEAKTTGGTVASQVVVPQGTVPSASVEGVLPYVQAMDQGGYVLEAATVDQNGAVIGVVASAPIPDFLQTVNVPAGAATLSFVFRNSAGAVVP